MKHTQRKGDFLGRVKVCTINININSGGILHAVGGVCAHTTTNNNKKPTAAAVLYRIEARPEMVQRSTAVNSSININSSSSRRMISQYHSLEHVDDGVGVAGTLVDESASGETELY